MRTRKPIRDIIGLSLKRLAFGLLISCVALLGSTHAVLALSAQDIRLLCSGLGSTLALDDDAKISIDESGLRVTAVNGKLTVFEGDEQILEVNDFSYEKYTDCVNKLLDHRSEAPESELNTSFIEVIEPGSTHTSFVESVIGPPSHNRLRDGGRFGLTFDYYCKTHSTSLKKYAEYRSNLRAEYIFDYILEPNSKILESFTVSVRQGRDLSVKPVTPRLLELAEEITLGRSSLSELGNACSFSPELSIYSSTTDDLVGSMEVAFLCRDLFGPTEEIFWAKLPKVQESDWECLRSIGMSDSYLKAVSDPDDWEFWDTDWDQVEQDVVASCGAILDVADIEPEERVAAVQQNYNDQYASLRIDGWTKEVRWDCGS